MSGWIVYPIARDVGPSVAPDWRMWSVSVTDDVTVESVGLTADNKAEDRLRRSLAHEGLTVLDVSWEPVCRHDLNGMTAEQADWHVSMDECQHFILEAQVRVPGREGRHAYEQVCQVLGVRPKSVEVA